MKPFSIVIVTYNNSKHIKKCLESINKHLNHYHPEIIIIDNNSSDQTLEIIKKTKYKVIENSKNLGFAKAVNMGIKKSKNEYIILLNPDTLITNSSLTNSFKVLDEDKKVGIIGGKLIPLRKGEKMLTANKKPTLGTAVFEFTILKKILPNNHYHKKFWFIGKINKNKIQEVDAVCGAFLILRKQYAKKVGFFDENFFLYLEDLDFCLRVKKCGLKVIYNPKSKVKHLGGGSSPNKYRVKLKAWYKSRKYFFKKHLSKGEYQIAHLIFWIEEKLLKTLKKPPFHEHNLS